MRRLRSYRIVLSGQQQRRYVGADGTYSVSKYVLSVAFTFAHVIRISPKLAALSRPVISSASTGVVLAAAACGSAPMRATVSSPVLV